MNKKLDEISDEEFIKIIKFHSEQINELYEYIAFYIAKGIEHNIIFDNL